MCKELDRLQKKNFCWGDTDASTKFHLVNWDQLCSAKGDEGQVFLAKLDWRLSVDDALWCKVLKSKYLKGNTVLNSVANRYCSHTWRSIQKGQRIISEGAKWCIVNGNQVTSGKINGLKRVL